MVKFSAAILIAALLGASAPVAGAQTAGPTAAPPAAGAPAWKPIYETNQTIYYVSAAAVPRTGRAATETMMEFKVPQVIGSDQVWSVVSRLELSCDEDSMLTVDNSYYPRPMGAGAPVQSQGANDAWHTPEAGSLGELVWSTLCRK